MDSPTLYVQKAVVAATVAAAGRTQRDETADDNDSDSDIAKTSTMAADRFMSTTRHDA